MSIVKTLLIGTLAVVGGCTVVVGGCTVGVVKTGINIAESQSQQTTKAAFNKIYDRSPRRAFKVYEDVVSDCYSKTMKQALGTTPPAHVVKARVDFDIYQIKIERANNPNDTKHLATWRKQSNKKNHQIRY